MRPGPALLMAGLLALPVPGIARAEAAPGRVVSMNLCTDQLAMLLAAPGQLISVSELASDPRSSVMVDQARGYAMNHAQAEEIYLMKPDLVLAGTFTSTATVSMLRRLGIPVATFPPAYGLADVRLGMLEMGRALRRDAQAAEMVATFDAGLAALQTGAPARLTAVTYAANGYTPGSHSLSGEIIRAAGFRHLADDLGLQGGGVLPLELLVLAQPDLVITGEPYPGGSRAEEILHHPALAALRADQTAVEDRDWVCGLPSLIPAIGALAATRAGLEAAR